MQEYNTPNIWNRSLTIIILILCFLLVWGVLHIYEDQKSIDKYNTERELQLINQIQRNSIFMWRQQHLLDAASISEDDLFGLTVGQLFLNRNENIGYKTFKGYVVNKLRILHEYRNYDAVFLVDLEGNLLINNLGDAHGVLPDKEMQAMEIAKKSATVQTVDPRQGDSFEFPYFSVIAPIYKNDKMIASVWLVVDVRKDLYPILSDWPIYSNSAESYIINKDNGKINILNNLRFLVNDVYLTQAPPEYTNSPSIQTINGMRGLFEGVDYRNKNVIAVSNPIQGSNWFLITKIDKQEAVKGNLARLLYLVLPILIAIFISGTSIIILQWRSIKKQSELQVALEKQVYLDPLTGISNRRGFNKNTREIIQSTTKPDFTVSLLMIDIDNFKEYNDFYGHIEGDKCLINVARIISNSIIYDNAVVSRLGGEEFAIFLPNINMKQAQQLAEKIRRDIYENAIHNQGLSENALLSVSIGVTSLNRHQFGVMSASNLISKLLSQADQALYDAKDLGRDSVCIYNESDL